MDAESITVASPRLLAQSDATLPEAKPPGTTSKSKPKLKLITSNPDAPGPSSVSHAPAAKKPRHSTDSRSVFMQPLSNQSDLKKDLEGFGFSKEDIKTMMSKKDEAWDPAKPGHLVGDVEGSREVPREKRSKKNSAGGGEKEYEPLFLPSGGSSWALFDPLLSFPPCFGDPPAFMEQYATFIPGNSRILEYNVDTHSVRIKSTPAMLRDRSKGVEYTKTGPKLVDIEVPPVKKGRGRPRKSPLSTNGPVNGAAKTGSTEAAAKPGKLRRPKKVVVPSSHSEDGSDGSDSSLTDLELADGDGDDREWMGEEVEVKVKIKRERVEVEDSEDEALS